ncbi:MAG: hypothetical protein ACTSPY_05920 [Candidatus Helarchaeota archaeon]
MISIIFGLCISIPFIIYFVGSENYNEVSHNNFDENNIIILESGTYTGFHLYGKNLLVPAGIDVSFKNATIYGGEIYVYGRLIIENSVIDHPIHGYGNGTLYITNITGKNSYILYLYENSNAIVRNVSSFDIYYGYLYHIFDNSNLTISNCNGSIILYDNAILKSTNLSDYTGITLYKNSKASIFDSDVEYINCFQQSQAYLLNSSIIHLINCLGTPNNYPYNTVKIFKDNSSSIISQNLVDDAQIIDI